MFEDNPQVQMIYTMYTDLVTQIEELDEAVEPSSSGRKILNDMTKDSAIQTEVRGQVGSIMADDDVVRAYVWLKNAKALKAIVDKFINENSTSSEINLSEEERATYEANREQLSGKARGFLSVLQLSISDEEVVKALPAIPRKPTAGVKRGKRIKGYFTYVINGEDVGHLSNKDLSAQLNLKKQSSLTEALEAIGLNPSELPDFWEVTVNTKTVTAERAEAPEGSVEDNDDEDVSSDDDLV